MAVLFTLLGLAAAHAFSGSSSNWCEDLVGECRGSPELVTALASADPSEFLPGDLADYVAKCADARRKQDAAALAALHVSNPLRGVVSQMILISRAEIAKAMLPASGGRFVVGCPTGRGYVQRSIQVRADLPEKQQRALLKNIFANIQAGKKDTVFTALRGRSSSGEVVAYVCDVAKEAPVPAKKKCAPAIWSFVNGGVIRASEVPGAYVEGCVLKPATRERSDPPPRAPNRTDEAVRRELQISSRSQGYSKNPMAFDTEGCGIMCRGTMRVEDNGDGLKFIDVLCKANRDGTCPDANACMLDNDMDYLACSSHPKERVYDCQYAGYAKSPLRPFSSQKCGRVCSAVVDCRVNGVYEVSGPVQCAANADGLCPDPKTCRDDAIEPSEGCL